MKKKLLFVLFFMASVSVFASEKKVHFSIDDVNYVLKDLTKNENKYASAFEHSFFNYLKCLHDKYGAIITLYCFYELNGFSLDSVTSKFSYDFATNSNWLKFGYHSYNENYTFVGGGIRNL